MGDGGLRVWLAAGAFSGVLPGVAVHLVQPLGLGVPRLEVVAGQRQLTMRKASRKGQPRCTSRAIWCQSMRSA